MSKITLKFIMYKVVNKLLILLLSVSFVGCIEGIHRDLVIKNISTSGDPNFNTVQFGKIKLDGTKDYIYVNFSGYNLYDSALLEDLRVQKLISDSLARKGLTRLLDIDFDDRKIINISDYSSNELIDKLRSDRSLSNPADTEDIKKSDENEDKDGYDPIGCVILIFLMILIMISTVDLITRVIQMREYRNEIKRTASEISSIINMKNKSVDPDKDLRTNLMILGYDPKVVSDIIDEVNKEIK